MGITPIGAKGFFSFIVATKPPKIDNTKIGFYGLWMMMRMIQSMENKKNK